MDVTTLRHDHDIAVLQHQVGQVERLQQDAVGHDLEKSHDHDQGQQHAVFAHVVLQEAAVNSGGGLWRRRRFDAVRQDRRVCDFIIHCCLQI